jgi:hypothetical protein
MRVFLGSMMVAATVLATAAMPQTALARAHPRVQPSDCGYLAAKVGPAKVWQASFWGQRLDDFGHWEFILVAPCFAKETTCVDWLYWAQSDWPDHQAPGRCKKGMPYSHY